MSRSIGKRLLLLASAGSSLIVAGPAFAQATRGAPANAGSDEHSLEEIVVTAERRESSVQRTASSVSVRAGDDLREEGKFTLRDILEDVPGVVGGEPEGGANIAGGKDSVGSGIIIRGLSSNRGVAGTSTSVPAAVAVYTDDIYEGIGGNYDVDRVEILRGPQGTLYGRSATGGVVAIHTRDPDLQDWGGMGLTEAGNYSLRHVSAALNAPIVEGKLAVRVAGDYFERDGYDTAKGIGLTDTTNARVKVLAKPTENLFILVGASLQDNETASGGKTAVLDASGQSSFAVTELGSGKNRFRQVWANIQWDLGFATLTYIPSYRDWYQNALNISRTPNGIINQPIRTPKDDFVTHEARLTSNGESKLIWQVGVLDYYNNLDNYNTVTSMPSGVQQFSSFVSKKTQALGVFGEATLSLTDTWRLTGGLRHDDTTVNAAQTYTGRTGTTLTLSGPDGERKFDNWTYKIRTEVDLSPRNLVYLSYSTGASPGDVSLTTDINGQPTVLELKDQTLKALEVGSKNRFFDDKVQANLSLFHYDYSGYQNQGIDIDPGPALAFTTLVAPQRSYGGEAELAYQPAPSDRFSLDLAYVHARYVDRSALFVENIARNTTASVPPFTAGLSYSHRFEFSGGSNFTATLDGRYLSPRDVGTITAANVALGKTPLIRESDTVIGNLNGTWTSPAGRYSLGAYVRNIGDERYPLYSSISNTGGATLTIYQPRTVGMIASANF